MSSDYKDDDDYTDDNDYSRDYDDSFRRDDDFEDNEIERKHRPESGDSRDFDDDFFKDEDFEFADYSGDDIEDSTEQNPCVSITEPGIHEFDVTLTVSNDCGDDAMESQFQVTLLPESEACFDADQTSGCAPLQVCFTNCSTGSNLVHSWDFNGDGVEDSDEENPCYTYEESGTYTVSLTVTGTCGEDTETKEEFITMK